MGNLGFISFKQVGKWDIGKSREEIVKISTVVLNGARRFPFAGQLFNEGSHERILLHQGTTGPIDRLHIRAAPCLWNVPSGYH